MIYILGGNPGLKWGSGDGTDPFLNPEFPDFLIFIKSTRIYILKNPLCDSIKGEKNMVEFGPIQMIAMGFPNQENLHGELISELFRLSDYKIIRMVGFLAIAKNQQGKIASLQLTQLSDNDRIKLAAGIGALIGFGAAGEEGAKVGANAAAEAAYYKEFGLDKKQINNIAQNIPNGTAAGFVLIEHLWAKRFKEIALSKHAVLLANGFITMDALVAMGAHLAEGVKAAEKVKLK